MDEQGNITKDKVPDNLKRLVRLTGRAFYKPLQIVCLDILTTYPCVAISDLVEVLKMHGSQKQLQQALTSLKNDKMVKWSQKMEKVEGVENIKMMHYYYINYKEFVNVVKYKLDQMRKKLESEDRMSHNRTSYSCSECKSTFTDLDVGKLFDPTDGTLRCSNCRNVLEEEETMNTVDSRTLISQLNEYVKDITELLRETENLNLAAELLEPEAQSIQKYLQSSGIVRTPSIPGKEKTTWTPRSATDIYETSTAVSVSIGDGGQESFKVVPKERPEWLVESTVHISDEQGLDTNRELALSNKPAVSKHQKAENDRQILEDLIAHENKPSGSLTVLPGSMPSYLQEGSRAQYSSSSSEEEDTETGRVGGASSVSWMGSSMGDGFDDVEEFDEESSEEEEDTVMVGEKVVPVTEVTKEMVAAMTAEEKERYTIVYRMVLSRFDDYS